MAAVIGFLMIIAIVVLLLKGKMSPIVVLAVVPAIAAHDSPVFPGRDYGLHCGWY